MNAALLKAIGAIASDPDSAKKVLAAVCAVVIGALGVMFLPVYVLLAGFGSNATEPSAPDTKNSADLAAWARKAYFEGWGYEADAVGQMNSECGIPTTDTLGLVTGYLMYDPATKVFDLPQEAGTFQTIGTMDTMPDAEGIGLFNGDVFGIYIGSGDVILASETLNCVAVEDIRERSWTYWMLFEGIQYPESVTGGTE